MRRRLRKASTKGDGEQSIAGVISSAVIRSVVRGSRAEGRIC